MALSDSQIERYSRQIIVPEVGGRGQERLLASRLLICGEPGDIEPMLAYMAGAGVGKIFLHTGWEKSRIDLMIAEMRMLNPDSEVVLARDFSDPADLVVILAGSEESVNLARKLADVARSQALILARLDIPGKIAVMTKAPPCPICADAGLLAPVAARAETAGLIAMAAAVEAFKLLIGRMPSVSTLLEFDGYQCTARELKAKPGKARCGCSIARAEAKPPEAKPL
jgi:molybdopterin/thiamine biosynthesis adenylyltransferase